MNGAAVWANGYLPAAYQGTLLRSKGSPILNLTRPDGISTAQQRREFDVLASLNGRHFEARPDDLELAARINAYELAFRMQTEAPELVDLSEETQSTQHLYGLDDPATAGFGRQCLTGSETGRKRSSSHTACSRRSDWTAQLGRSRRCAGRDDSPFARSRSARGPRC